MVEKCRTVEAFGEFFETIEARSTLANGLEIMITAGVVELTGMEEERM